MCGFDILRTGKGSLVCDVNGWSFVKGSTKYYNDSAVLLRRFFLDRIGISYDPTDDYMMCPLPGEEMIRRTFADYDDGEDQYAPDPDEEQLRGVVIIVRHGDRKPKEKVKFKSTHPRILSYFNELSDPTREVLIKTPDGLMQLLETVNRIIHEMKRQQQSGEDNEADLDSMEVLRAVLVMHDQFSGLNRKIQLKPIKWDVVGEEGKQKRIVSKALVVAKWGGELSPLGITQAEDLGRRLRVSLYDAANAETVLRLHSTFRHDFKIYSSLEGRCQSSAAAFTKGFLDLEGDLTPILISLVTTERTDLLDEPIPKEEREEVKDFVDQLLHQDFQS